MPPQGRAGVVPDFLMATSMGTFAALEFAQCLTVREAVRAVVEQARLLETLCLLREIDATYLWDVIRKPIRFDAAATMLCTTQSGTLRLIDVGLSGTLATSLKYGKAKLGAACEIDALLSPFGAGAARYERIVADLKPVAAARGLPEPIAW
ncbi:hypothetical protein AB1286_19345 [Trinickia sp. NRRL B-1857]|uniref:hypothetical protein n=1 Tax=Trinickia sp. NRRL B-1857 TaxID=3162879 RepID=UPI003D2A74C4